MAVERVMRVLGPDASLVVVEALTAGPEASGVGQYARLLLQALSESDLGRRILVVTGKWDPPLPRSVRVGLSGRVGRALVGNLVLPFLCRRRHVRGLHATDYGVSPLAPSSLPVVITVHDVAFLTHPHFYGRATVLYKRQRLWAGLRRAACVVTVSRSSAEALTEHAGVDASRIRVIYPGVDPAIQRAGGSRPGPPQIGFLGQLTRRKNVDSLVEAFAIVAAKTPDVRLLLAGRPGTGWPDTRRRIAALRLPIRDRVEVVGPLPRSAVARFLSSLDVFVFPSWNEGFGFPPLEAMACGVPVLASDASCLPEILGDAALYAPPGDPGAIAEQIERALFDTELIRTLVARGYARAALYRWDRTVRQLSDVYQEVFGID